MVQLPRRTRLLNLSLRIESLILSNRFGETKITLAIVVSVNPGIAGTKQNLFAVICKNMEPIVAIPIVEYNLVSRLEVIETQDIGKCSLVMPDTTIFVKVSLLVALQNSAICVQHQAPFVIRYVRQQLRVAKNIGGAAGVK